LLVIDHFGRKKLMIVGSIGYILSLGVTAWAFYTYGDVFATASKARAATAAVAEAELGIETLAGADLPAIAQMATKLTKTAEAAEKAHAETTAEAVREMAVALKAGDRPSATEAADRVRAAADVAEAEAAVDSEAVRTGGTIVLVSLLVFIASHAFGQGAVIWVFISEIFPNRVRARGQALGSFTHWFMAAGISWTFPMFAEASGGHTFAFYGVMMVLQLFWVLMIMPETKGIPLEEIQKKLGIE
jgi:SP family arabinose:H+ symporter-like MFS transporter